VKAFHKKKYLYKGSRQMLRVFRNIVLFLLIGLTILCCRSKSSNPDSIGNSSIEQTVTGKTRIEGINEMTYRIMSVPSDLKSLLLREAHLIWNFLSEYDLSKPQLLKINGANEINLIVNSSQTKRDLRNKSYELWKTKDFILTALVYRSSSISAITGKLEEFFVLEIEHEKLTGTYYIFIPSSMIWDESTIKTNYVDRN
jgi:hypothetical protein